MIRKSYSELIKFPTFEERYRYLKIGGEIGAATFGHDRYINQRFYGSREWKLARDEVVARDLARDLGVEGHEIMHRLLVHHMNPIVAQDFKEGNDSLVDPENLICVTHNTHNAIHFGDDRLLAPTFVERRQGDTCLW